jgi:predicted ATPase
MTIESFGLNRLPLVKARSEVVASLKAKWQTMTTKGSESSATDFAELASEELSFLALRRQCLSEWATDLLQTNPASQKYLKHLVSRLEECDRPVGQAPVKREKAVVDKTVESFKQYQAAQDAYSVERESEKSKYYSRARFIERLEIKNFRGIQNLLLDFPAGLHEQGSWLLMLGENGTGKTSVLNALALALMGEAHRRKFLQKHKMKAHEFVRYGCDSGYIKVHLTNSPDPIVVTFRRGQSQFKTNSANPMVLLLGYGATRLLPLDGLESAANKTSSSHGHASKADNLFNPFVPLNDAQAWLASLSKNDFDFIARGLKELLLLEKEELIKDPKDKRKILIKGYRSRVPLDEMSAGFQSVVALTADVMSVLRLRWTTMDAAEGIVLVDELDAHLHPRWKMQIVSRLRAAFPRLQFIVSSHDPLCLRGLHAGEVVVMKRDASGRPIVITDLPAPDTLRVEQILTSEFFGLNSTVEPEIDRAFNKYYRLLALPKPTAKQLAEIAQLKAQLRLSDQLGTTRRERVMLEAVDKFLAEHDQIANRKRRTDLKQETQNKIAELWKTVEPVGEGVL